MTRRAKNPTAAAQARRGVATTDLKPSPLLLSVLHAARRRCDAMGDGPDALADMKRDVLATPPELLPDLLQALATECVRRADLLSIPPTYRPQEQ